MAFELANLYVTLQANTGAFNTSISGVHRSLKKVEVAMESVRRLGRRMFVTGAGIAGALGIGVKEAASFQQQLAMVSTMLDDHTMNIMPRFKKGMIEMSIAYGEGTATLTKGLYDFLSAQVPVEQALYATNVAARAAAAGITDTGTATKAIIAVMNSYALSADRAGDVSDLLFATVKKGVTTFAEIAPAIGTVAGLASMAGVSLEDLGASIAAITAAGISSREAVTSLNAILREFATQSSPEAEAAALKFNLVLNTATLRAIGLGGAFKRLKKANVEQLSSMFPAIRAIKGVAAALQNAEGYAAAYEMMLNRAGETDKAFAKVTATLTFEMKRLWQMTKQLSVAVGDILLPSVSKLVDGAQEIAMGLIEWVRKNSDVIISAAKLAAGIMAVGAALFAIGVLFSPAGILGGVATGILTWSGAFDGVIEKLDDLMEKLEVSGLSFKEWANVAVLHAKVAFEELFAFLKTRLLEIKRDLKIAPLDIAESVQRAWGRIKWKAKFVTGLLDKPPDPSAFAPSGTPERRKAVWEKFNKARDKETIQTEALIRAYQNELESLERLREERRFPPEIAPEPAPPTLAPTPAPVKTMAEILADAMTNLGSGFKQATGGVENLIRSIQQAAFSREQEQLNSRKKNTTAIKALTEAQKDATATMKDLSLTQGGAYLQMGI